MRLELHLMMMRQQLCAGSWVCSAQVQHMQWEVHILGRAKGPFGCRTYTAAEMSIRWTNACEMLVLLHAKSDSLSCT